MIHIRFIYITPKDFIAKIESSIPKEVKHLTGGFYDIWRYESRCEDRLPCGIKFLKYSA